MSAQPLRFVTPTEAIKEEYKGRTNYWVCRPDLTETQAFQICQATLPPGEGHNFHTHPELEEVIYVLAGEVEQWVEQTKRILRPGEVAHILHGRRQSSSAVVPLASALGGLILTPEYAPDGTRRVSLRLENRYVHRPDASSWESRRGSAQSCVDR